jgi:hypothetical protein
MKLHEVEYFLVFLLSLVLLFVSLFSRMKEISTFAFARKLIVSTLTSTTYNVWIFEVKKIAVRSRVWEYMNSKESESESLTLKYSRFSISSRLSQSWFSFISRHRLKIRIDFLRLRQLWLMMSRFHSYWFSSSARIMRISSSLRKNHITSRSEYIVTFKTKSIES